jgi:Uma2 family endonuclease
VKEYWIVTPWPASVEVLLLDGSTYRLQGVFGKDDALVSPTFPDLRIRLADVFNFPLEPHEQPPKVREPPPKYRAG